MRNSNPNSTLTHKSQQLSNAHRKSLRTSALHTFHNTIRQDYTLEKNVEQQLELQQSLERFDEMLIQQVVREREEYQQYLAEMEECSRRFQGRTREEVEKRGTERKGRSLGKMEEDQPWK